ncbi:MAG: cyclic dehypoxanthinyl futalosine synthase [bacterium]|nr:cyclic dehypoxanthinyl futalosine synthase [bacterium]
MRIKLKTKSEKKKEAEVLEKAYSGQRLDAEEGLLLFDLDLISLGKIADKRRRLYHPEEITTFIINRNITFTNICVLRCKFCAFSVSKKSKTGYLLSKDEIIRKVEELVKIGGTQVMLQGGVNPELSLDYYCDLLRSIKAKFDVWFHSLSPTEIYYLSKTSGLSIKDVLLKLKEAGLDSLPGAAEILVDRVRKIISPHKLMTAEWLTVMREAHSIGMKTTATMTFGMMETKKERIEHLLKIRELADSTQGFTAFIPWTFSPKNTKFSNLPASGGVDYLKMVAISRIMLDNIPNIQAGWVTEGPKLAQISLFFGANDLGGTLMEEVVIASTGISHQMSINQAIELIKGAGKQPCQRDTGYNIIQLY